MVRRFQELAPVFERSAAVVAAWVFGSVARGDARPDSDIDVAVLLRQRNATVVTHRRELFELATQVECAVGRRVDLVVLTLRDSIIAHRVLSEGVLVFDRDPDRRQDFAVAAVSRYFDWAPKYASAAARGLEVNRTWARENLEESDGHRG
ncbi:MAG: nucleotidyltransferase domain-containing protein [Myxococcota bacterium]